MADTPRPSLLLFPLGAIGAYLAQWAVRLPALYDETLTSYPEFAEALIQSGFHGLAMVDFVVCAVSAVALLMVSFVGFVRRPAALGTIRRAYILLYIDFWFYAYNVIRLTGTLFDARPIGEADNVTLFFDRWNAIAPAIPFVMLIGALHILAWRRSTINIYEGATGTEPAWGDRIVEDIRTHGKEPQFRKSWISSITAHVMVIIIIPWLFQLIGCVEPYRVPKGSGNPVVALVKIVKPKKQKKKKMILRPDSAIYFHVPDLDESKILEQVQQTTELQYKTSQNAMAMAGRMGRGGGKEGGWPDGMENSKVRFIRMEYRGSGWDDGMDAVNRADMNFLEEFNRLTGFKIATKPESHAIRLLKKYDKGFAPPFVYMTGDGNIDIPDSDRRILRDYLIGGGMLFADCGSAKWDKAFRSFIVSVFPGEPLIQIADDDPLFQMPYTFPNGAPPLWHHGGNRALGMKYKGRWCVFYHPGDINDAWKTGHSGMAPEMAEGAFQMGVNIVYYSFTQYLELTAKYRK